MKTFKRKFLLRENPNGTKLSRLMMQNTRTLNTSKVGRHRRGRLLLNGWDALRTENGVLVELEFIYERRRTHDWRRLKKACKAMGLRLRPYRFADHNKLLKTLTEASVR